MVPSMTRDAVTPESRMPRIRVTVYQWPGADPGPRSSAGARPWGRGNDGLAPFSSTKAKLFRVSARHPRAWGTSSRGMPLSNRVPSKLLAAPSSGVVSMRVGRDIYPNTLLIASAWTLGYRWEYRLWTSAVRWPTHSWRSRWSMPLEAQAEMNECRRVW